MVECKCGLRKWSGASGPACLRYASAPYDGCDTETASTSPLTAASTAVDFNYDFLDCFVKLDCYVDCYVDVDCYVNLACT